MVKTSLFALVLLEAVYSVVGETLISIPTLSLSFSNLPSTTSSSSSASSTPIFIFGTLPTSDVDTCSQSFTFSWTYGYGGSTPPKGLTLYVTNVDVDQPDPPTESYSSSYASQSNTLTDRSGMLTARAESESVVTGGHTTITSSSGTTSVMTFLIETLSTDLDPTAQSSFTWQQANIPQGWYEFGVNATDAVDIGGVWSNFGQRSDSFFVRNGSDVSCLITNSGGSSTQTSSQASASATTTGQTGVGNTPVPTSGSLSSSGSVNKGAVAGGVIGGVAVIAAVLGTYFFMRRSRKGTASSGHGSGGFPGAAEAGGKPSMGKWGILGSFDSANAPVSRGGANTKDVSALAGIDDATATNTAANARSQRSNVFGLGGMGLAALGFAKSQSDNPQAPPTAYTGATSKKSRRMRHSQTGSHVSAGTIESLRGMMSTSPSDSSFSPTSSGHEHSQPYGWFGYQHHGVNLDPTRPSEDDDYVFSPYDEKNVPMRTLSPTSSSAHSPSSPHAGPYQHRSPFSDHGHGGAASPLTPQAPEEHYLSQSYPPSSDSVNVPSSGVGLIPIAYEPSPFATPPPSAPASRTNSRSYSRNSGSSLPTRSVPSSAIGAVGHSSPSETSRHRYAYAHDPSQSSLNSISDASPAVASGRLRAKSELPSPTSPHSARMYGAHALDVPVTPGNDSLSLASSNAPSPELVGPPHDVTASYHTRRASSPDVIHANFDAVANKAGQSASGSGSASAPRRAHRKPVPVYGPEEQDSSYFSSPSTSTQDHSTVQTPTQSRPGPTRRPVPDPTSSYATLSQNVPSTFTSTACVQPHALEHKDSAQSLASLRHMEGDLSGYGAGGKQMHLLIPDMPLAQD